MTSQHKVMCIGNCFVSAKSMHSSLLTWRNCRLKYLKNRNHNAQNRRSSEISSRIFETYKNVVRPHGFHIYNTSEGMAMAKMCPCTSKHYGILHLKCVLHCCYKCPSIVIPSHEENKDTTKKCLTIIFHVYFNVSRCTVHLQCKNKKTNNMFNVFHISYL